jgi:hypothetical protein
MTTFTYPASTPAPTPVEPTYCERMGLDPNRHTAGCTSFEVTDTERKFPKGSEFLVVCDEGWFGWECDPDRGGKNSPALPCRNNRNSTVSWKRISTAKKWLKAARSWAEDSDMQKISPITRPRIIVWLPTDISGQREGWEAHDSDWRIVTEIA